MHRALLASRSTFFEGACRNPFREADTGIIDLTEDDPEAVEHMVNCTNQSQAPHAEYALIDPVSDFYYLDYLSSPLSRRSSQRSSRQRSPLSPRIASRPKTKKLNLALIEDPLVAMASAASHATPLTPPEEQADQFDDHLDADLSAKLPDTPMAEQFEEDPFESVQSETESAVEKPHLVTHAKVYAIAEK